MKTIHNGMTVDLIHFFYVTWSLLKFTSLDCHIINNIGTLQAFWMEREREREREREGERGGEKEKVWKWERLTNKRERGTSLTI